MASGKIGFLPCIDFIHVKALFYSHNMNYFTLS